MGASQASCYQPPTRFAYLTIGHCPTHGVRMHVESGGYYSDDYMSESGCVPAFISDGHCYAGNNNADCGELPTEPTT